MKKYLIAVSTVLIILLTLTGCKNTKATSSLDDIGTSQEVESSSKDDNTSKDTVTTSTPESSSKPSNTSSIVSKPTVSTPSVNPSKPTETVEKYSKNNIEFIGRFVDSELGKKFDWSGSTITAGFIGTKASVKLYATARNADGKDYFNVIIDDNKPFVLTVTPEQSEYVLASGLKNGHHTIKLIKRTEAQFGMLIEFAGFVFEGGKPAPAPARKDFLIEIYGDSISAGYGNEGKGSGFRLQEENASLTYGMLAAEALNAEATVVACSGYGMALSLGGESAKVLPDYYNKNIFHVSGGTISRAKASPKLIVINLGTNDFAMNIDTGRFYTESLSFVKKLKAKNPDANIVLMVGGGTTRHIEILERVVQVIKISDSNAKVGVFVSSLDLFSDPDFLGADGHPTVKAHKILADELVEYVRTNCDLG